MMEGENGHGFGLSNGDDRVEASRWATQARECSMCGDVGFADKLHQCTRCGSRHQHTYCSSSTEGLRTGTWMCDWCRLAEDKAKESPAPRATYSVLDSDTAGLESLLKAALCEAQYGMEDSMTDADGGPLYSFDLHSVKEEEASSSVPEAPSCSSEDTMSHGDEGLSASSPRSCRSDNKKNPKSSRFSPKVTQKKRQKSLIEQQCGSVQLKRLSSMKSTKTEISCDPPRAFVRRYKSLSDISF